MLLLAENYTILLAFLRAQMTTVFISDLHLQQNAPEVTQLFVEFMDKCMPSVDALYILGDFFEVWLGDDDCSDFNLSIMNTLQHCTQQGVPIYIMHGNRDFLLANKFAQYTGCQLIPDPHPINLYGTKALLCHGDGLCIADKNYQRYRKIIQCPFTKTLLRTLPLAWRQSIAKKMRQESNSRNKKLNQAMVDIPQSEMQRLLLQYDAELLIHGHIHWPLIEYFPLADSTACRIVLDDWGPEAKALIYRADGQKSLQSGKSLFMELVTR